jgi:hypothetical protein
VRLFIGDFWSRAGSIDNDAVNQAQIAHVCLVNTHTGTGFDRGSDHFAVLVHNVTRPVENMMPGIVNPIAFKSAASNVVCSVVSSTSGGRTRAHSGSFR